MSTDHRTTCPGVFTIGRCCVCASLLRWKVRGAETGTTHRTFRRLRPLPFQRPRPARSHDPHILHYISISTDMFISSSTISKVVSQSKQTLWLHNKSQVYNNSCSLMLSTRESGSSVSFLWTIYFVDNLPFYTIFSCTNSPPPSTLNPFVTVHSSLHLIAHSQTTVVHKRVRPGQVWFHKVRMKTVFSFKLLM